MTEKAFIPESWAGRDVNVRYADADAPRWLDCTVETAGALGVAVSADGKSTFFPWSSVIRIELR